MPRMIGTVAADERVPTSYIARPGVAWVSETRSVTPAAASAWALITDIE